MLVELVAVLGAESMSVLTIQALVMNDVNLGLNFLTDQT